MNRTEIVMDGLEVLVRIPDPEVAALVLPEAECVNGAMFFATHERAEELAKELLELMDGKPFEIEVRNILELG